MLTLFFLLHKKRCGERIFAKTSLCLSCSTPALEKIFISHPILDFFHLRFTHGKQGIFCSSCDV